MSECTHDCSSCGESCADRQGGSPFQIKPLHEGCHVRKVYGVVSGKGGTGKTSFTANVGLALAALGCHTLCLDCDITLRNLDLALGLSDRALMDFSDVIAGRCTLEDAVVQHPKYPKLHLLTAPLSARPVPIAPEQMKALLDRIRQTYDLSLIHI